MEPSHTRSWLEASHRALGWALHTRCVPALQWSFTFSRPAEWWNLTYLHAQDPGLNPTRPSASNPHILSIPSIPSIRESLNPRWPLVTPPPLSTAVSYPPVLNQLSGSRLRTPHLPPPTPLFGIRLQAVHGSSCNRPPSTLWRGPPRPPSSCFCDYLWFRPQKRPSRAAVCRFARCHGFSRGSTDPVSSKWTSSRPKYQSSVVASWAFIKCRQVPCDARASVKVLKCTFYPSHPILAIIYQPSEPTDSFLAGLPAC